VYVNGVPFFTWGDTTSYQSEGVWHNLAMSFELYDVDVCLGHAAQGVYHRKSNIHAPAIRPKHLISALRPLLFTLPRRCLGRRWQSMAGHSMDSLSLDHTKLPTRWQSHAGRQEIIPPAQ
jgi:hypothetical protein